MANFQIRALPAAAFAPLFRLSDTELKKQHAVRITVDKMPGFPCRVSLEEAAIGEEVILLGYQHQSTISPYQSAGAIFVRKGAVTANPGINEIPAMLLHRLLSLRGFTTTGMMEAAIVTEGVKTKEMLDQLFSNPEISYVHIHNAKPGCYNCVAERVE